MSIKAGHYLLFQCPGCWGYTLSRHGIGNVECNCGERMTMVDLRSSEAVAAERVRIKVEVQALPIIGGHIIPSPPRLVSLGAVLAIVEAKPEP